ncbi:MAG: hypothetical protein CEE38_07880 [Planctomycetes bacterium B3_Pla]|nr:MAG: hypothetical protein CEE38_07880 [Planctomycetes bacterium B3_Pla]
MDNDNDITSDHLSPNRSNVAYSKAILNKKREGSHKKSDLSILENILKESKEQQASLVPDLLWTIEKLGESIKELKLVVEANRYNYELALIKIENLKNEVKEYQVSIERIATAYAKLRKIKIPKTKYHEGCSQLPADS